MELTENDNMIDNEYIFFRYMIKILNRHKKEENKKKMIECGDVSLTQISLILIVVFFNSLIDEGPEPIAIFSGRDTGNIFTQECAFESILYFLPHLKDGQDINNTKDIELAWIGPKYATFVWLKYIRFFRNLVQILSVVLPNLPINLRNRHHQ